MLPKGQSHHQRSGRPLTFGLRYVCDCADHLTLHSKQTFRHNGRVGQRCSPSDGQETVTSGMHCTLCKQAWLVCYMPHQNLFVIGHVASSEHPTASIEHCNLCVWNCCLPNLPLQECLCCLLAGQPRTDLAFVLPHLGMSQHFIPAAATPIGPLHLNSFLSVQGSAIKKSATMDVGSRKKSRLGRVTPATAGKKGQRQQKQLWT